MLTAKVFGTAPVIDFIGERRCLERLELPDGLGGCVDRGCQSYQMVCRAPGPMVLRALSLLQLAAMVVWWSVEVVMKEEYPAQPPR